MLLVTKLVRDMRWKLLDPALEKLRGALVMILARETRLKVFQQSSEMLRVLLVTKLVRDTRLKIVFTILEGGAIAASHENGGKLGRFCKTNLGTIFGKVLVRFRPVRYLWYLHAL